MRQIATISSSEAKRARLFVDYLASLSIEARLEDTEGGDFALWICDEDDVSQAKEEHEAFRKDPTRDRYRQGAKAAQKERAVRERETAKIREQEREMDRKVRDVPKRYLTIGLMALSVILTLVLFDKSSEAWAYKNLFISGGGRVTSLQDVLPEVQRGQVWRLITPIFLHVGGIIHLVFNMLWLLRLGSQVETREGIRRLLLLVIVVALISNLSQYVFSGAEMTQDGKFVTHWFRPGFGGMSGVIYGLFGYVWMKVRYQPSKEYFLAPMTVGLMMGWLFLCMTGFLGPVANTAHFVGLLIGIVFGYGSAWLSRTAEEL